MAKKYTVVIEKDENDWFVSEVVELPGCHTQAKTIDELLARTKEAIEGYLEDVQPTEIALEFVGVQQIEVCNFKKPFLDSLPAAVARHDIDEVFLRPLLNSR